MKYHREPVSVTVEWLKEQGRLMDGWLKGNGSVICDHCQKEISDAATWQPIATAPRDKTPIWLYVAGMQTEAWYDPLVPSQDHEGSDTSKGGCWVCADDQWSIEVEEVWGSNGVEYLDGNVTHWRPLPTPPDNLA